jgi:DNA polymerase-3 subunit epsilon
MSWGFGRSNQAQQAKLAKRAPSGPLQDYLSTPLPVPATPLAQARLLAIDIETTGLDPARDQILSVGFVPVDGPTITLSGASQLLVRPSTDVGESARFHGLTDDALTAGVSLSDALAAILGALSGRVLLAHHAAIETGFLSAACQRVYGASVHFAVVDTIALQFGLLSRGFDDEPPKGSLRLWAARGQYGLPHYAAHEALTDALACAELYLAQIAELQAGHPLPLKAVLKN